MNRHIEMASLSVLSVMMVLSTVASASAPRFMKTATVDLNSDGVKEKILLAYNEKKSAFTLTVSGHKAMSNSVEPVDGFMVVDIDTKDNYKEIAVHTPGPSEDDIYWVYGFNTKGVKLMGILQRWPVFKGQGDIYVRDWMGFWEKTDKYVLDNKHRELRLVPQKFYPVGQAATVREPVSIYKTPDLTGKATIQLKPKSKVMIAQFRQQGQTRTDGQYLVKSSTGIAGWTDSRTIYNKFAGLSMAD